MKPHYTSQLEIDYGYCHCGCGQKTALAKRNYKDRGILKGQPLKHIQGHGNRLDVAYKFAAFWSNVAITANDNLCWEWLAGKDKDGYGTFRVGKSGERSHRIAWAYPNYIIPEGMLICHSCDNPSCVNPKHLFLGTNNDNMKDMAKKGRTKDQFGEKNTSHKLTTEQIKNLRLDFASGLTRKELANKYNIDRAHVSLIVRYKARTRG